MDVKPIRRAQPSPAGGSSGPDGDGAPRAGLERTLSSILLRPETALVACLMLLPLLLVVSGVFRSPLLDAVATVRGDLPVAKPPEDAGAATVRGDLQVEKTSQGSEQNSPASSAEQPASQQPPPVDKLLGGLLAPGFDEHSCLSRYQSAMYHRAFGHNPPPYLVERLRKYEALHKKCGPGTELYKKSIEQLKANGHSEATACQYLIALPRGGLGNMVLSLAASFVYALVTNRVFLVYKSDMLTDLFCEPFPESSWVLPEDFPIQHIEAQDSKTPWSYGNMVKNKQLHPSDTSHPPYAYVFLAFEYSDFDKLFYCEEDQTLLNKIPWLAMRTDQYFVPGLYLLPAYVGELNRLFPKREVIFHHVARYLFHPTNSVWGMITRYHKAYLARADEKLGIQIRIFWSAPISKENMLEQVLDCTRKEGLLPDVSLGEPVPPAAKQRVKAVLITTLYSGFYDKIKTVYYEHPAATGEIISVHQPTHEEKQQMGSQLHNQKAWAEMYMLSFSDVLVTTAWSTFGYIAQGLGGLRPWILTHPDRNGSVPNPTCTRGRSIEPCYHFPPNFDCRTKGNDFSGKLAPHIGHCEDLHGGLKVIDD